MSIAAILQPPVPFASGPELIESIVTALVGAANYREGLTLTHGRQFVDNRSTEYTGALPADVLQWIKRASGGSRPGSSDPAVEFGFFLRDLVQVTRGHRVRDTTGTAFI